MFSTEDAPRILVVDDDPSDAEIVSLYLSRDGYAVSVLDDPTLAIGKVADEQPALVILDILMPAKSGWELLRELKADQRTRDVPVIICSVLHERKMGLLLGAAEYLTKPIIPEDLLRTVRKFVPDGSLIVVVDDDPDDMEIVSHILRDGGYRVETAGDGSEGLRLIASLHPDVVILDLLMPTMDGFEVLRRLRSDLRMLSIPVIVVTAKDLTPEERRTLRISTEALLQKGAFSGEDLCRVVARCLEKRI